MFGYCGAMGVVGWLLMLGFYGAFIALVLWAVTRLFPSEPRRDAVDLLDQRFAAGDIDADTYRLVRRELVDSGPPVKQP